MSKPTEDMEKSRNIEGIYPVTETDNQTVDDLEARKGDIVNAPIRDQVFGELGEGTVNYRGVSRGV